MARHSHLRFLTDARIDPRSPVPKHRQVYSALAEAIRAGKLNADDPLPSSRELAGELGVSRNTVLAAYEQLLSEGYVTSRGGAGTFVSRNVPRAEPPVVREHREPRPLSNIAELLRVSQFPGLPGFARPFRPSSPAIDAFPYNTWSKIGARIMHGSDPLGMMENDPLGHLPLRKAIARHLHAFRSAPCDPRQVIITSGAQLGLFLCSMLLVDPNDLVWIEEPGYRQARFAFRCRTERVIPVPLDDSGINIEAGKALAPQPRLIYTTPTHQWPLGVMMSHNRRLDLLKFAAEHGSWVIEDDYDGDLRFDRRTYTALWGIDEAERVIHIGTFSKSLSPGVRLGYLVVPPDLVNTFVAGRQVLDRFPNAIAQAVLAEFMEGGGYARHVYDMQALYRERHELLRERIARKLTGFMDAKASPAGTFTVTELATGLDDIPLAAAFQAQGFESLPLSRTYTGPSGKRGLLLGHAVATPEEIRKGVDTLEQIASSWPRFASTTR